MPTTAQTFFSQGISRGLLYWLVFRHSLNTRHWADNARTQADTLGDNDLLLSWLQAQPSYPAVEAGSAWAVNIPGTVGTVMGAVTMFGACSYSGAAPVNLWLLLGLFAFLPLVLTVFALLGWRGALKISSGNLPPLARILLKPISKHLPSTLSPQSSVLKPWLFWKLQWVAVAFQLSALATFCLIVLFQDMAFGWSSTVVESGPWVTAVLQAIAWPWHWLLEMPSQELIDGSRFYRGMDGFDARLLGQWWSYIAMATVFYGLFPRLFLALWMRYRVKRLLQDEMQSSGDIDRFLQVLHMPADTGQTTANTTREMLAESMPGDPGQADSHYIAWQCSPAGIAVETTLGTSRWSDDEAWIKQNTPDWEWPAVFLVTLSQTPTEEFADVIQLLRRCNSAVNVELQLLADTTTSTISRHDRQLKSWRLFAQKHQINIGVLVQKAGQGATDQPPEASQ